MCCLASGSRKYVKPMHSSTPLLSVVIPTHKRPQFLPCAIDSALQAAPDGDVEVIVVPNGKDESWKTITQTYAHEPRVHWQPIEEAHANAARNHGLAISSGKYVRFLDDDDYLFPNARTQCLELDQANFDASQGGIDLVDAKGEIFRQWHSAVSTDYVASMLRPSRITHNCAMLYRRDKIISQRWDASCGIGQDTAWALSLARDFDLLLHRCDLQTGAWVQHDSERISTKRGCQGHNKVTVEILLNTLSGLESRGALTDERRLAAAEGIWQCIHNAFPLAPIYWTSIIHQVHDIAPNSKPADHLYSKFPFNQLNPIVLEWLMTPHRFIRIRRRERAIKSGLAQQW